MLMRFWYVLHFRATKNDASLSVQMRRRTRALRARIHNVWMYMKIKTKNSPASIAARCISIGNKRKCLRTYEIRTNNSRDKQILRAQATSFSEFPSCTSMVVDAGLWDCVAAVERLPALHNCVDFIFLSFGIMGFIVEL